MPARLAAFLAAEEPGWSDLVVVSYEPMTGGYSRLLAKAVVRHDGITETLVVRGDPPADKTLIHTDRAQEWAVIRLLSTTTVRCPAARWFDPTGDRLGTPALVLDFSTGQSFLPYAASGASIEGLNVKLADALATVHSLPIDELPEQLERPADWDSYIGHRIDEWRRAAAGHVEDMPIMRFMAGWLDAHRPAEVPLGLIHGDFQSANLMVTADGEFEMLDWELASIGDPREDIGYFKAVAQAAPPDLLDDEGCAAFCARYRELRGWTEAQLNPAVVQYFLILGVVGTVRRLLEGGGDVARGKNRLVGSIFNLNSLQFGNQMWLAAAAALGPVLDQLAATSATSATPATGNEKELA